MNQKSLDNLKLAKVFDSDLARQAEKKSVESRKINKEARERLRLTANELKTDIKDLMAENSVTALDVLRLSMIKAYQNNDIDQAIDIAKSIAEFETPKLGRIEQTNIEVTAEDMTDEELERRLKDLLK